MGVKHCFVCGGEVDESNFESQKCDGNWVCSQDCADEYLDMDDIEYADHKQKYEDYNEEE